MKLEMELQLQVHRSECHSDYLTLHNINPLFITSHERSHVMRYKSMPIVLCIIVFALMFAASISKADDTKSAAKSKFGTDYLSMLDDVQTEIMRLEQAIPQEKFTWRPTEGVRSISEVYAHIAGTNYFILKQSGYEPPADINIAMGEKAWSSTTDKKKLSEILKRSFDHLRATVASVSETDLDKKVKLFGREVTLRSALLTALGHLHEHLGQSIAYARMNGVVPPWTAEAEAKAKEKAK
jgi:uncharacterized damage-inducible protein DinB